MDKTNYSKNLTAALKLVADIEDGPKEQGIDALREVLSSNDSRLVELGHNQVIFKELIKFSQFEAGKTLEKTLDLLRDYYYNCREYWDELVETLTYRVARSNDHEVCRVCLEHISLMVNCMDESVAKHSKQLLKLSELNRDTGLNSLMSEILLSLKSKLPQRKNI